MISNIYIHGPLRHKFALPNGEPWRFDIWCPHEAIAAIDMARPGFRAAIRKMTRHVFIVRVGRRKIRDKHLILPNNGKSVHITPILEGAASAKGIIDIVAGVVLIAAGFIIGPEATIAGISLETAAVGLGLSLALGGIAQLLAPTPAQDALSKEKNKGSYIFNGAFNSMQQGGPMFVAIGENYGGSQVISADVSATDITKGSNKPVDSADNTGSSTNANPAGPAIPAYHSEL